MKKIVIAIDGYSACGKSTTAKLLASKLGYAYIDTGAMYRATTLFFHKHYINLDNDKAIKKALEEIHINFIFNPKTNKSETYLNGLNVEAEIRKMYVSDRVSEVSAVTEVRRCMVSLQKKLGRKRGVVMDGRDIGTAVFPDAELKIFMEADIYVRAFRRQQELFENKQVVGIEEIIRNIEKRDFIDTSRSEGPLRKADDAHILDTTYMTVDEQVDYVINLATVKMIETHQTASKYGS